MPRGRWADRQAAEVRKAKIHGFACGVLLMLGILYAVLLRWMV